MIVGTVAISSFEYAPLVIENLSQYCDLIVLRFDTINGNRIILEDCVKASKCPVQIFESSIIWNRWNWREEMVRALDNIRPNIVICPDQDELLHENFIEDLKAFKESGKLMCMFDYAMITDDKRKVPKYPGARHMKMYKWLPGIKFQPYRGYAMATFPVKKQPDYHEGFMPKYRLGHLCFFTKEMESKKVLHK